MKKVFFSVAVLTIAFAFFAFSPVEKKDVLNNKILSIINYNLDSGTCDFMYEVDETFRKCITKWTESIDIEQFQTQIEVLSKY
ncbi:MAG: hypothetical protein ACK5H1_09185 [Tenacibaculum sp.]